jgi:small subunit ribosomal protein S20
MANIKSAMKRAKTNEVRRMRNKGIKTNLKTCMKSFDLAIKEGNVELAQENYRLAAKKLDQASMKGIIHVNSAARKKSSMTKRLNAIAV